jgi:hypothetical protein
MAHADGVDEALARDVPPRRDRRVEIPSSPGILDIDNEGKRRAGAYFPARSKFRKSVCCAVVGRPMKQGDSGQPASMKHRGGSGSKR